MRRHHLSRLTRFSLAAGFLLHTVAVLWIWRSWAGGLRGGWLVWMDLPLSLLYAAVAGRRLLAASLLVGGVEWALIAAGLTYLVGRSALPE